MQDSKQDVTKVVSLVKARKENVFIILKVRYVKFLQQNADSSYIYEKNKRYGIYPKYSDTLIPYDTYPKT